MKLFGKHLVLIDDAGKALLEEAGHDLLQAPISAAQHLVAAFKASPEGQQVLNIMHTVENRDLSGPDKAAAVLGEAVPLLEQFVTQGGHPVVARLEDLGREAVQSFFDDVFSAARKGANAVGAAVEQDASKVETAVDSKAGQEPDAGEAHN